MKYFEKTEVERQYRKSGEVAFLLGTTPEKLRWILKRNKVMIRRDRQGNRIFTSADFEKLKSML